MNYFMNRIFIYSRFTKSSFNSPLIKNLSMKSILSPPDIVKHMTVLNKDDFKKVITVPIMIIHKDNISKILKKLKKYLLKLNQLDSISVHGDDESLRQIFLNPEIVKNTESVEHILRENAFNDISTVSKADITLEYKNWNSEEVLRAVLPDHLPVCSGYSRIGHIIHINLRDEYFPYKYLIGQVYLDKISGIKTVVNKTDIIDNTFRTFAMEFLAGESNEKDMEVTVKENGCSYTFDFSKVYWNPRLSTEHERIIKKLKKHDILYDVMAGVGPFSIPAAKKGCVVLANDLNPHSFESLNKNCLQNKINKNISTFNLDGKEFIKRHLKDDLYKKLNDPDFIEKIHITMNLPGLALEFLPSFIGLFNEERIKKLENITEENFRDILPQIHIYFFSYNDSTEFAIYSVASKLGFCKDNLEFGDRVKDIDINIVKDNVDPCFWKYISEVITVRNIATAKVIMRVSFFLPKKVLIQCERNSDLIEVQTKRQKII